MLLCFFGVFLVTAAIDVGNITVLGMSFIVVKATVDVVQFYCVLCGVYFG